MRPSFDEYFMAIAKAVSSRATCKRRKVGAVVVSDGRILSTGYNGSIKRLGHCTDVDCLMEDGHCIRTVHAEANALVQAANNGVALKGGTIYTTASPCWNCFKLIANAGIVRIVYADKYDGKEDGKAHFIKYAEIAEIEVKHQPMEVDRGRD